MPATTLVPRQAVEGDAAAAATAQAAWGALGLLRAARGVGGVPGAVVKAGWGGGMVRSPSKTGKQKVAGGFDRGNHAIKNILPRPPPLVATQLHLFQPPLRH